MKPIIIYSDKILDRLSWFLTIGGITLWPWIILREKYYNNKLYASTLERVIRHESIHIKQQAEMLIIPFYIWYVIEYVIRAIMYLSLSKAYRNISFEREAYANELDASYLENRKWYSWTKYISK